MNNYKNQSSIKYPRLLDFDYATCSAALRHASAAPAGSHPPGPRGRRGRPAGRPGANPPRRPGSGRPGVPDLPHGPRRRGRALAFAPCIRSMHADALASGHRDPGDPLLRELLPRRVPPAMGPLAAPPAGGAAEPPDVPAVPVEPPGSPARAGSDAAESCAAPSSILETKNHPPYLFVK